MTSLGVFGDPESWIQAGDAVTRAVQRLQGELRDADSQGGAGLAPNWHGPVADSYQEVWRQRYERHRGIVDQATPAVSALRDFGAALARFQQDAVDLEGKWLRAGLVLSADGLEFMLPVHHASLPQEMKNVFEVALGEARRDVADMWQAVEGAVDALVSVLKWVAEGLEDVALFEWALAGEGVEFFLGWAELTGHGLEKESLHGLYDVVEKAVLDPLIRPLVAQASEDVEIARTLSKFFYHHGNAAVRQDLKLIRATAEDHYRLVDLGEKAVRWAGPALAIATAIPDVVHTCHDIGQHGVAGGLERGDNVQNLTEDVLGIGLAVGLAAGVGAGVIAAAPPIAVFVVSTAVIVGVGWSVQQMVNHRAAIGHATVTAVHDAGEVVASGLRDVRGLI